MQVPTVLTRVEKLRFQNANDFRSHGDKVTDTMVKHVTIEQFYDLKIILSRTLIR